MRWKYGFYSSVILNGTETRLFCSARLGLFYSSVILNGTETRSVLSLSTTALPKPFEDLSVSRISSSSFTPKWKQESSETPSSKYLAAMGG